MKVIDNTTRAATEPLVGGVIVSHAHLGSEFLAAAEMILGKHLPHITSASVDWHDDVDVARHELERVAAQAERVSGHDEVPGRGHRQVLGHALHRRNLRLSQLLTGFFNIETRKG